MSKEKKPTTGELYARRQWSDNMSFSRQAMDESKKKTTQLDPDHVPETLTPSTENTQAMPTESDSLGQYVNEMSDEIHRMSDAVGDRLDNMGSKFKKAVKPLRASVDHVAGNAGESLRNMRNHIGKSVLQEFTSVVKNLSTKVSKNNTLHTPESTETETLPAAVESTSPAAPLPGTAPLPKEVEPERPPAPAYTWHFGKILEQKIFFATIHNRSFLSERDIKEYNPEDAYQMHEWMERAVAEVKNCAPYGQKLPTPTKGLYVGISMYDILRQVTNRDVERFLGFVYNRPQPFQQKALKLSEAFATWAHKGAPEK